MNVFEKRERSWRKARKRGVSPIIATILLVAITVVLAAVLYVLISGLTTGGANTVPIGTAFSFGTVTPKQDSGTASVGCAAGSTTTPEYCYSIGISSAGSSATTANVHFGVLSSGNGVTFTKVSLVDISGNVLATYTTSGGWVAGTSTLPVSMSGTMTIVLDFGTSSASGDSFQAVGVGALQGQTSIALP